jgi:hypothetical protein
MSVKQALVRAVPNDRDRQFHLAFALACVGLPLLYLDQPLHFDEAIYLVVGEQLAAGRTLYVDIIDHKPPGIFLLAAAGFEVTARPHLLLRVLSYGATAVSGLVVAHIGRLVRDRTTGIIAGLVFVTSVYLPHFDGFFFMTEQWAVLATVLAAALLVTGGRRNEFAAGCSLGVGVLFNQTVFLFGAAVIAFHLVRLRWPDFRTRSYLLGTAGRLVTIGAGFLVPVGAVLAAFSAAGVLGPLLHYSFVLPLTAYSSPFELYGHLLALASLLPVWALTVGVLVRVGVAVGRGRPVRDATLFVALWAVFLAYPGATAFAGDHKLLFAFAPVSLLAAIGLQDLTKRWRTRRVTSEGVAVGLARPTRLPWTTVVIGGLVVALIGAVAFNGVYALAVLDDHVGSEVAAADRVDDRVEGQVYVWPAHNHLYYFSDDLRPVPTFAGNVYNQELARTVIEDLRRHEVEYVVVAESRVSADRTRIVSESRYFERPHGSIVAYLNREYDPVAETDGYVLFRAKQ